MKRKKGDDRHLFAWALAPMHTLLEPRVKPCLFQLEASSYGSNDDQLYSNIFSHQAQPPVQTHLVLLTVLVLIATN
jgi:hypothetical protein